MLFSCVLWVVGEGLARLGGLMSLGVFVRQMCLVEVVWLCCACLLVTVGCFVGWFKCCWVTCYLCVGGCVYILG